MAVAAGQAVREERLRRGLTLEEVARHAGISRAHVQDVEAGAPASLEAYARIALALGLRPDLLLGDPRRLGRRDRGGEDLVHAAMGELEVRRLRPAGCRVAIDEPYQHFQFAGRADVVAWDPAQRWLLHIENRTRFPNVQEAIGSYGAKRAYLADALAARWGIVGGWRSVTHVIVALWSSEVLHVLRLRSETFRAVCPDLPDAFAAWWRAPSVGLAVGAGTTSTLVVLDPLPGTAERHRWLGFEAALRGRPRLRGYADAASQLERDELDSPPTGHGLRSRA